jgi:hypothetical protein
MHHRIAIAIPLAATLIGAWACTDRQGGTRVPTEPGSATVAVEYVTTHSAAVVDPVTHRLETITTAPPGVSASVVGSVVTQSAFSVYASEPGIAPTSGHTSFSFTDDANHVQKVVFLYRSGGGPPATMQHYVDGSLVSTTAYSWLRTTSGWLRTRSYMQSIRNGTLVGTYTTLATIPKSTGGTGPAQPVRFERAPNVSPSQRVLGAVAYALAFSFAPQDATAQSFYFAACRQQWLKYAAAAAVLAGAAVALGAAPEIAPATLTAFLAALATAASMEDSLIDCMIANDSLAMGGFGGGGFGGATGGLGGGDDCLEGSYAAHCTTPFTL